MREEPAVEWLRLTKAMVSNHLAGSLCLRNYFQAMRVSVYLPLLLGLVSRTVTTLRTLFLNHRAPRENWPTDTRCRTASTVNCLAPEPIPALS